MKQYKTILLDADNTLFDFNKAEKVAIKQTFENFNIKCDDELALLYHVVNDKYWKKLERNEITKEELNYLRFEEIFESNNIKGINALEFNDLYKENLAKQSFLIDNALEIVQYLFSLNKTLIIASNGSSSIQHSRLNNSKLKDYILAIYTSQEAGYPKPSKEYFDSLFSKFDICKNETILIGDSPTADIKGGYLYNIDTIFFSPTFEECSLATYTVNNLLEIKNIIK